MRKGGKSLRRREKKERGSGEREGKEREVL